MSSSIAYSSSPLLTSATPVWRSKFIVAALALLTAAVMPLVGFYQPDKSFDNGGTQLGNNNQNVYGQLLFVTGF